MTQVEGFASLSGSEFALDLAQLRSTYFDSLSGAPAGVVSRKTWAEIIRFGRKRLKQDEQDLHQSVYAAVLEKFPKIVTEFAKSGREGTKSNFEAWLTVCIRNLVIDSLRRLPAPNASIDDPDVAEIPEPPRADPESQLRMHLLFERACEALPAIQREIVEKRLGDRQKPAALAAQYGLPVAQVYKLIYESKLRLRNEIIRLIVEERFDQRRELKVRYAPFVRQRCSLNRPCHFYSEPCPFASCERVVADAQGGLSLKEARAMDREGADWVRELLEDRGLPAGLLRCFWAATDGRGKNSAPNV